MGLFDFLKTTVKDPKKAPGKPGARKAAGAKAAGGSYITFDGKSFPIAAITTKGFVTSGFDGSLISGQNAKIAVTVNDAYGRFDFACTVMITEADNSKCVGAWMMLAPELDAVIRKYGQNKKAAGK